MNPQPGAYDLLSAKISCKLWEKGPHSLHLALESNDLLNKAITYPDYPNKTVNSFLPLYAGRTVLGSVILKY